ncbi:MAG TPA: SDR family oxidoreductase [Vicinamibacterales bacterium]|nr:SDR family oxidoreductase [Vicinamibacterales bacterium]
MTAGQGNLHALVVGGTRGIGRTLVRQLSAAGNVVSVLGRSRTTNLGDLPRVRAWPVDVADSSELDRALAGVEKENGPASGVVLLQRYRGEGDEWAGEVATTLVATRQLLDWASQHLQDQGEGKSVVVISSIAGVYIASEQPVSYHMAKAALTHMVRYYAVKLGPRQIRVNAISPGTIVKEESKAFYRDHPDLEQLYREIVPLGRMGTADDVAHLAQFLLSARASFLTGQNIVLDGGASLHSHESLARSVSPLRDLNVTRSGSKPS